MIETKKLIDNIKEYIKGQEVPSQIKEMIEKSYSEYEIAYKKFIANIGIIIKGNKELEEKLARIKQCADREYEEDKMATREMANSVFEHKLNRMQEKNIILIRNFVEEEFEEDEEEAKNSVSFEKENQNCAVGIRESVVSEIDSSAKGVITKVRNYIPKTKENEKYIENLEKILKMEVNKILSKAKGKMSEEVIEELRNLDEKVEQEVFERYQAQKEIKAKRTTRANFVEGLAVKVDSEEALKRVIEEQQKETALSIYKENWWEGK